MYVAWKVHEKLINHHIAYLQRAEQNSYLKEFKAITLYIIYKVSSHQAQSVVWMNFITLWSFILAKIDKEEERKRMLQPHPYIYIYIYTSWIHMKRINLLIDIIP